MNSTQKFIIIPAISAMLLLGGAAIGTAGLASAQSADGTGTVGEVAGFLRMRERGPHIGGTITAISGTSITITADGRHGTGTYTIDASSATVRKDGAESFVSALAVGERIMAQGSIDGTNVTATTVMAGMPEGGMRGFGKGRRGKGPGVMGTVSAVNGTTLTVTGMNGTTYTVEAGSASVERMVAGSIGDIIVGDRIGVHGSVSGTTVTAERIMDDMPEMTAQTQQ